MEHSLHRDEFAKAQSYISGSPQPFFPDAQKLENADVGSIQVDTIPVENVKLYHPMGIDWCDEEKCLFVADYGNHRVIRVGAEPRTALSTHRSDDKASPQLSGTRDIMQGADFSVVCGAGVQGYKEGNMELAHFRRPTGVACSKDGHLYVVDHGNHCIRKFSIHGEAVWTCGRPETQGCKDGSLEEAEFTYPCGIAIEERDGNGEWRGSTHVTALTALPQLGSHRVYITDTYNHRLCVLSEDGTCTTVAGHGVKGFRNGRGDEAMFHFPRGVVLDPNERGYQGPMLYISDELNHCIRRVRILDADVQLVAGTGTRGYMNGSFQEAHFDCPGDLSLTSDGDVLVVDRKKNCIRLVSFDRFGGEVVTILKDPDAQSRGEARKEGRGPASDGTGLAGISSGRDNYVYLTDCWNSSIRRLHLNIVKLDRPGPNRVRPVVTQEQERREQIEHSVHTDQTQRDGEDQNSPSFSGWPTSLEDQDQEREQEQRERDPGRQNQKRIDSMLQSPETETTMLTATSAGLGRPKNADAHADEMYRSILQAISQQVDRFKGIEAQIERRQTTLSIGKDQQDRSAEREPAPITKAPSQDPSALGTEGASPPVLQRPIPELIAILMARLDRIEERVRLSEQKNEKLERRLTRSLDKVVERVKSHDTEMATTTDAVKDLRQDVDELLSMDLPDLAGHADSGQVAKPM